MELKLRHDTISTEAKPGFNRTFMELKLVNLLLVVHTMLSFNRTFMELKPPLPLGSSLLGNLF